MKYIKLYEQYSDGEGLKSEPFSQISELRKFIDIEYPIFHKTPFLKNVPKIIKDGVKRVPNKILHYIGFGGNPFPLFPNSAIPSTGNNHNNNNFEKVISKFIDMQITI